MRNRDKRSRIDVMCRACAISTIKYRVQQDRVEWGLMMLLTINEIGYFLELNNYFYY